MKRKQVDSVANEAPNAACLLAALEGKMPEAQATEIAGLSRSAFIDALGHFGVAPFQYEAHEAIGEAGRS